MSDNVPSVTDADFEAEVLKSELPVLIDFSAVWCMPCKMVAPIVDALAVEMKDRIKVRMMDVDASPKTPAKYGIRGIPTLLLFKGGDLKESIVGAVSKDKIVAAISKHLS
ncbi:MAG: thioredoxin [Candidatus Aminicenantes bacterium]|nr:thioredoxin [Candidatus Aminicenantes bacterium]